jgi:hypothetical protein
MWQLTLTDFSPEILIVHAEIATDLVGHVRVGHESISESALRVIRVAPDRRKHGAIDGLDALLGIDKESREERDSEDGAARHGY